MLSRYGCCSWHFVRRRGRCFNALKLELRTQAAPLPFIVTLVIGLVAGGVAGLLFITAQLTADPLLISGTKAVEYAQRSIPYAVAIGFIAGLTSDVVFGKLVNQDVFRFRAFIPIKRSLNAPLWFRAAIAPCETGVK